VADRAADSRDSHHRQQVLVGNNGRDGEWSKDDKGALNPDYPDFGLRVQQQIKALEHVAVVLSDAYGPFVFQQVCHQTSFRREGCVTYE
jgi:hypothetical protein